MQLEDLRIGAAVHSQDGHKLGTLSKFVVTEGSLRLTHVVVDTGILRSGEPLWKGGWGLSHDRVIPLASVAQASSDRIELATTADEFKEHSADYAEEYFEPMPDIDPGSIDLGDVARVLSSIPGEPGPWLMFERRAIAPHEVEIPRDAPVWRLNPHQKVGEVERVIFDQASGILADLVIRRGFIFSHEVMLPVRFIVEVVAGIVRVDIDDESLRDLPEFRSPE